MRGLRPGAAIVRQRFVAWQPHAMRARPIVAVAPASRPDMHDAFTAAVVAGGAEVGDASRAEALVWADPARAAAFPEVIAGAPGVRWVQLPYAGIEPFASHLDDRFVWTCGKGVYAAPVAEHALALLLAGFRHLVGYSRATRWEAPVGRNLLGANVVVLGGGGITEHLVALLAPFGCRVTVYRRRPVAMAGTRVVTDRAALDEALGTADAVVLALALTPDTEGVVDASFLHRLPAHAWVVNVARGRHVVTDDLLDALRAGRIGGAALDVTDPEPLPGGHPLFSLPNCIVTPHIANTPEMGLPLIAARVRENVARFVAGEPLLGSVDVAAGY